MMEFRILWLCGLWIVALTGWHCAPDYPELPVFVEEGLGCMEIESFGDGSLCTSPEENGLADCGAEGGCAPDGVCVADKTFLGCRCFEDVECEGWAAYINQAKGHTGEELMAPVCYGGGCVVGVQIVFNLLWCNYSQDDVREKCRNA